MRKIMDDNKRENIVMIKGERFEKFIGKEIIYHVVLRLAEQINRDYSNKRVVFIVVLKGAVIFASDLLREINIDCELEFVRASSYGNSMTNKKLELNTANVDVEDREVIIIEDIIDTGISLNKLIAELKNKKAKSVEAISLLSKPEKRKVDVNIKYVGIEIPVEFVIGYGMDYAQAGRQLANIYSLVK